MRSGASGLRAWVFQRITAGYLALFTLYLAGRFILAPPADAAAWRAWVAQPTVAVAGYLFFLSLMLHAWIGVRDVLIDYVHPPVVRHGLLLVTGFALVACGLWAAQVILLAAV